MQINALKREYRPFTREAAARVAKEFGLAGNEHVLLKIITRATQSYERYRLMPDYHQRKDGLQKLSKAVRDVAMVAAKHQRELELPLHATLLRRLGELLTYEAIEKLLGSYVARQPIPARERKWEDHHEQTRLDRSILASEAGPKLLVALFREMQSAIDDTLADVPRSKAGRRTKHLYRQFIITVLAEDYEWFFDKRPTSTAKSNFSNFCRAILEELGCELRGFEKAIPVALKKARLLHTGK